MTAPHRLVPALHRWPGLLGGAALLLVCQALGEAGSAALGWPVPGAVLGMLLLWALLCLLGRVPEGLDAVAGLLLAHLMLPLVPRVAGISEQGAVLRAHGAAMLLLCVGGLLVTTVCAAAAYAAVQRVQRRWCRVRRTGRPCC